MEWREIKGGINFPQLTPVLYDLAVAIREAASLFAKRTLNPRLLAAHAHTLELEFPRARLGPDDTIFVAVLVCRPLPSGGDSSGRESDDLALLQNINGYWLRSFAHVIADVLVALMMADDDDDAMHYDWPVAVVRELYLPALPDTAAVTRFASRFHAWAEESRDFLQCLNRSTVHRPGLADMFDRWLVTDLAPLTTDTLSAILPAGAATNLHRATSWVYVTDAWDLAHVWQATGTQSVHSLAGDTEEEKLDALYRRAEAVIKASTDFY